MPEFRSCLFLLTSIFAGWSLVSGTRNSVLTGCSGDSKDLFQNITFNNHTVVSLYKNGSGNMLIAMWFMNQSGINEVFYNGYTNRLFHDKSGNIGIRNLNILDEATYTLKTEKGSHRKNFTVQLFVLVPPTLNCKPKITQFDHILTVHLASKDCGKPAGSVYWLNHSGISYENNVLQLQPGNEDGIYYACLQSEALRCTNISKPTEYCDYVKINQSTNLPGSSESSVPSDMAIHTMLIIVVCFIGIIAVALAFIAVQCFLKRRKNESTRFSKARSNSGSTTKDESKPFFKDAKDSGSKAEDEPNRYSTAGNDCGFATTEDLKAPTDPVAHHKVMYLNSGACSGNIKLVQVVLDDTNDASIKDAEGKTKAGRQSATEISLEEYCKGHVNPETNLSENKSQQTDIDEYNRDTELDGNGGDGRTESGIQSTTERSPEEDFKGNVSQKASSNKYKSHQTDTDENKQDTELCGKSVDGKTNTGRQSESETSQDECLSGNVSQETKIIEDISQQTDIDQNKEETELDGNENRDHGNQKSQSENEDEFAKLIKCCNKEMQTIE